MKGTLFSADFVKDNSGNLRLLEVNTDTGFVSASFDKIDYTNFFNIITTNSITQIDVIYKDFQKDFVSHLSQSVDTTLSNVALYEHLEEINNIYPATLEDSETKFILRLAYDESAVFDSSYSKDNSELFKLFIDNNDTGSITNFAYSSSIYEFDNLSDDTINSVSNLPDVVVKQDLTSIYSPIKFYKAGNSAASSSDRLSSIKSELIGDGAMVQQYYVGNESDSKVSSVRSFNIIYGTGLDLVNIAQYQIDAILEKPTSLSIDDARAVNEIPIKHYFELTTNGIRAGVLGIMEGMEITKADGTNVLVESASLNESYKSFYFNGSPDTDDLVTISNWSQDGPEIPTGSYETSSILQTVTPYDNRYQVVSNLSISGSTDDSILVSPYNYMMVYDKSDSKFKYEIPYNLKVGQHQLFNINGEFQELDEVTLQVYDAPFKMYELNLEPVDTYFIGQAGVDIQVLSHNCFTAGTQISLQDGSSVNIEDVKVGDSVLSHDFENGENVAGIVGDLKQHTVSNVIHIEIESGIKITTTDEHPFFVISDDSADWVEAKNLKVGDVVRTLDGSGLVILSIEREEKETTVYNLLSVSDHHNFYANGILVHNK